MMQNVKLIMSVPIFMEIVTYVVISSLFYLQMDTVSKKKKLNTVTKSSAKTNF